MSIVSDNYSKLYLTIAKIAIIVAVFLVVAINVIAATAYEFVYCHNEKSGITMTYPEGTTCGEFTDDNLEEEEEREDEEEHAEEEEQDRD